MKKRLLSLALAALLLLAVPSAAVLADSVENYPAFYSNFNPGGVTNHPQYYPDFHVTEPLLVQALRTYHWNGGQGAAPGYLSIYDWDDNLVGTWQAEGNSGSGAQNVYWDVFPSAILQPGHYYVTDSDDDTWSWNEATDGHGFLEVRGSAYTGTAPAEPSAVGVTVDGSAVLWSDAAPFIDANSRTMVPLRAVADALGLSVEWNPAARTAIFTGNGRVIYFTIASPVAMTSDGDMIDMDTAPVIVNDRTYAPIRYLAEYFNYAVGWDGASRTVTLTSIPAAIAESGGKPEPGDFAWTDFTEIQNGVPPAEAMLLRGAEDCAGVWKAMIYYVEIDGSLAARELLNIWIAPSDSGANVAFGSYKIHYADELDWRDADEGSVSMWSCTADSTAGSFYALTGSKLDGRIYLGPFWTLGGNMQYGYGLFNLPDGSLGYIALVRS